jgi:putative NADH-flavin reductase
MRLTIVAATGGIGRHLVTQALDAGHEVTAVVRNPRALPASVPFVEIDLAAADPALLHSTVDGADAVLSALGARSSADAGVAWRGTRAIVAAMQATRARRIVVVSAAPIGTVASPARPKPPRTDPGDGIIMRNLLNPMVKRVLRTHYADLAQMEDVLRDSGLDWTVVRPPKLTDKPVTGEYRVAYGRNIRGGWSISRADVAHYMLHVINEPDAIKQVVGIAT